MNKLRFAALAAFLVVPACQLYAPAKEASAPVAAEDKLLDVRAVEMFAADAVYSAHPTRALVDILEVTPAAELGRYMVHIEMTGAPESRDVFDLVVVEQAGGTLELISLEQVQGE